MRLIDVVTLHNLLFQSRLTRSIQKHSEVEIMHLDKRWQILISYFKFNLKLT